jgi:hypothetical protein
MVNAMSPSHSSTEARMSINSNIRLMARGLFDADEGPRAIFSRNRELEIDMSGVLYVYLCGLMVENRYR